jgi:hypothetical protein
MKNSVTDRDLGWKRIKKSWGELEGSFTKVGVQAGAIYENRQIAGGDAGTAFSDLVTIAAANEYGTKRIPSRPFMRNAFDQNQGGLREIKLKAHSDLLTGKRTTKKALALIGTWFEAKVKLSIKNMLSPPNAPSTIKRKKSSHPLIDTGQLIQSIRHVEVVA